MTHDEIQAKIADVLEEALGCDEDEIVPDASLTAEAKPAIPAPITIAFCFLIKRLFCLFSEKS